MIRKQLGIRRPKDALYLFLTTIVSLFVLFIFFGAFYQIVTGRILYNPLYFSPIRLNIQFPYLLGICVFLMYASVVIWLVMGIASIFYKKKRDGVIITEDKIISIIIPACNEEDVIGNILSDLICQSYKKFEILVVAHNCRDKTADRARMIQDKRIRVIEFNTRGSGKALALNEALYESKGEIIVQFDTDNRIKDVHFLRKAVAYFEEDPELIGIQSRLATSNPKASLLSLLQEVEYEAFSAISWAGREVLKLPCFLAGTGIALKKKAIEDIGGWSNSLVEDFELFTRLAIKKKRIRYADNLEVFDEKPITWTSLFKQRSRWVKGHLQVTWKNVENFGNILDYIYRLTPLSVFAWWLSILIYVFYFVTGQFSMWNLGNELWIIWTFFFQMLLMITLWKRGGVKKALLLVPQWFFGFHWTLVAILSLNVKSWAQTKTVHSGNL